MHATFTMENIDSISRTQEENEKIRSIALILVFAWVWYSSSNLGLYFLHPTLKNCTLYHRYALMKKTLYIFLYLSRISFLISSSIIWICYSSLYCVWLCLNRDLLWRSFLVCESDWVCVYVSQWIGLIISTYSLARLFYHLFSKINN